MCYTAYMTTQIMDKEPEQRPISIHAKVSETTLEAIRIMARKERRTVSAWISNALEDKAKAQVEIIRKARERK